MVTTTQPRRANLSEPVITAIVQEANSMLVIGLVKIYGLDLAELLHQTQATGKENTKMPLGKKKSNDACTRKVKARYTVWPSAYASGALVRCRKVGAKNWGNKGK
jgi:hypothetical protein